MVEVQKEERKGNQGDERFIQRMYMRNIAELSEMPAVALKYKKEEVEQ